MKILFVGGKLDGQLQEVDKPISPLVPTSINATLPNGVIVQYHVHFFQGAKMQFPLAVFEGLGPDQVFQMLLRWYAAKPLVHVIPKPAQGEQAEQDELAEEPKDDPAIAGRIITP